MNFNILSFEQLDSTNSEAARQARQGAAEGLCVLARQQTDGRGRNGRNWVSGKDSGLYFSVVLRPAIEQRAIPLITLLAGVAVHDTLIEFGLKPDIKWVNDVLVGEKKISGILSELIETRGGPAVIVGIGINLGTSALADEIASIATSIGSETHRIVEPEDVAKVLTRHLSHFYDILNRPNGPAEIIGHWRERSSYFRGKHVSVTLENEILNGMTDGLEDNGALRLTTGDGGIRIIQAGDVQRLRESLD
jgi:BirA family biotin operon repressor/biotin-[acetyl-CoA-carboxylase] ligase